MVKFEVVGKLGVSLGILSLELQTFLSNSKIRTERRVRKTKREIITVLLMIGKGLGKGAGFV